MTCALCQNVGWVCVDHPGAPWDDVRATICTAAGMPRLECNPNDLDHAPRLPGSTHVEFDKKG